MKDLDYLRACGAQDALKRGEQAAEAWGQVIEQDRARADRVLHAR